MGDLTQETIQQIAAMAVPTVIKSDNLGGLASVLVPAGWTCATLASDVKTAERPRRVAGTVKVHDAVSFISYFQDFRDNDSRIFADDTASTITGVMDYHEDNKSSRSETPGDLSEVMPRWCEHRLALSLRKSEEWQLWIASNTKRMSQDDFARFLEDNSPDLFSPEPATMLEIARSMTAKQEINVEAVVRSNKGATFRYNEVVKAGGLGPAGEFSVPDDFTIRIPVYLGSAPIEVKARLRYQVGAGKLTMWYDLWRFQNAERDAFKAVRATIGDATEVTILSGQPA